MRPHQHDQNLKMPDVNTFPAAIASGQSLSGQVNIGSWVLCGIVVPSTWTTASISLQASPDGGTTWAELYDTGGNPIGANSVSGGAYVALSPTALRGVQSVKVRSGSAASPVNQTSSVTMQLVGRVIT
jgi:hypothetical protein